jgi:hypothetical protein
MLLVLNIVRHVTFLKFYIEIVQIGMIFYLILVQK